LDLAIEDALRRVCELLGNRVRGLSGSGRGLAGRHHATHAYPAGDPSLPSSRRPGRLPLDRRAGPGRTTLALPSLDDLPAEAARRRRSARRAGIRSNVTFPARGRGPTRGRRAGAEHGELFAGLVGRDREPAPARGAGLASALERKRSEERSHERRPPRGGRRPRRPRATTRWTSTGASCYRRPPPGPLRHSRRAGSGPWRLVWMERLHPDDRPADDGSCRGGWPGRGAPIASTSTTVTCTRPEARRGSSTSAAWRGATPPGGR